MALVIDATVGGISSNSYVTLAEAETYFLSDYHSDAWDALTTDDLIVGINSAEILELITLQLNETKSYLGKTLALSGQYAYQEQVQMIAKKIATDNTTYGFNLYESGNLVKTDSISGVSI